MFNHVSAIATHQPLLLCCGIAHAQPLALAYDAHHVRATLGNSRLRHLRLADLGELEYLLNKVFLELFIADNMMSL